MPSRTLCEPATLETRLALGGVRVKKPNACDASTRRSPARHDCVTVALPGRTRTVFARRVTGCPGGNTDTDVGTREPPPCAGMQPTYGLKLRAPDDPPTYVPTKVTERDVVMPGLTGLPEHPEEAQVDRAMGELRVQTADDVPARAR